MRWEVLGDDDPDAYLDPEVEVVARRGRTVPVVVEDHHAGEPVTALIGVVREIDIVRSQRSLAWVSGRTAVASLVPGTVVLLPQTSVEPSCRDFREPEATSGFDGLVVLLDILREEPPEPVEQ